ncbi:P-loop containing nucleoside triphosphate hydrolase protein [Armillaria solidipes]|uniref:P-loop containing nucleoside triphosphate hydrolase protein n=1 Tax=Armillaria solidipes TaxID=1076256 RepID=A0A2H3BWG5_9AGAR|nr:P-loop containing nucleoside triphosphate hydrolase protein [Armillaria solidipes]
MGAAISVFLKAIRGSKVGENPTMSSISEQHRRMEAAEKKEREARRRVEELEREKKEQADKAAKEKEGAQKMMEEQRRRAETEKCEARRRIEELEKEKKEQADKAAKEKEAAQKAMEEQHRRAEMEKIEARRRIEELEREKKEQADKVAKEKEAVHKRSNKVQEEEEAKAKEKEAQKAIEEQHRRAEMEKIEARRLIEELDSEREKKVQAGKTAKEKEAAHKRSNRFQEEEEPKATEKEMMEAQKAMEAKWRKGVHPVEWPSREQYDMVKRRLYKDGKFHLAIAGKSGTGKSSLINAFRGIWDGEKGSASTDIVESTTVVTPYPDPNPANPFIWFDIPGSGTVNCPDGSYFNDQGLYIFDAIIVLLGDRFTEGDLAILKNCKLYSIPTYIVRSKSDIHINNLIEKKQVLADARRKLKGIHDEARKEYLDKTRETVRDNLKHIDSPSLSQRVYAVSWKALTLLVREESLGDLNILDEHELLRDLLRDAYSRRSEKSWRVMQDLIKSAGVEVINYFTKA